MSAQAGGRDCEWPLSSTVAAKVHRLSHINQQHQQYQHQHRLHLHLYLHLPLYLHL